MNAKAELISPPCPISQQESNWPLLAVSKGFFEGAMIKGNTTSSTSTSTGLTSNITTKLAANLHIDETNASGGDWADDEVQVELDQDEMNADPLHGNADEQGEGWGDTDLELPADLVRSSLECERTKRDFLLSIPQEAAGGGGTTGDDTDASGYFVSPSKGQSVVQAWTQNSKLPVDHVLSGAFESAMRLLHDQVGIVSFDEYKSIFIQIYSRSRTAFTALPSLPALYAYPLRNW